MDVIFQGSNCQSRLWRMRELCVFFISNVLTSDYLVDIILPDCQELNPMGQQIGNETMAKVRVLQGIMQGAINGECSCLATARLEWLNLPKAESLGSQTLKMLAWRSRWVRLSAA